MGFDDNNFNDVNGFDNEDNIDLNSFSASNNTNNKSNKHGKKDKKRFFNKSAILKAVLSIFLVCVITGCIVISAFMIYAFGFVDSTMEEDLNDLKLNFTTTIYVKDKSGEFVEYQRLHGMYNRIWVSDVDGNIPNNLKNAFIAVEDKRFKSHDGVDWKRTFSAFANLFFNFYDTRQGGSTITQQLVKNLTGDDASDAGGPARKIREIMRARDLEMRFSKDVILECYLNTVSMAGGMYGVEVASNYYFGKSTKDLTLTECAALAAIVKAPETYRPDTKSERNKERRQTVLKLMLDQKLITQEEFDASYNEELNIIADKSQINEMEVNSYFVDQLITDVTEGLMEIYDFDEKHASTNFYNGGYKIYATVIPEVQAAVDEVFYSDKYAYKKNDKQLQGAMTIMDYEGHIVGMAGGIGQKTGNLVLNRAVKAIRQPGSTIKPLSAYSLAIENDLITYSTIMEDKEYYIESRKWGPNNWYDEGFLGNITTEFALERSCNTIPVMLVDKLTLQASYDHLIMKFGIKNMNKYDIDYSPLGMGGTNGGLTTLEEAAAYATFGNGGIYYEPTTYYKVCDQRGNVILENEPKRTVAMGSDTATVMNHLLQNVVYGSRGTGKEVRGAAGDMKIFAKTGTSNDDMNCWFTGGTPYYVGSVWCGYDTLQKVNQSTVAKYVWRDVMSKAHKGLENKEFIDSQFAVSKEYCTSSGLLATSTCPNKKTGWYKTSNVPGMCTKHPGDVTATE